MLPLLVRACSGDGEDRNQRIRGRNLIDYFSRVTQYIVGFTEKIYAKASGKYESTLESISRYVVSLFLGDVTPFDSPQEKI